MGLFDSLFGNSAARSAGKDSRFAPTNISTPGFGGINVTQLGKRGRGGTNVGFSLSPEQQLMQALGVNLQQSGASSLLGGDFGAGGQYGLGEQYDPFVQSSFMAPGASSAFLGSDGASALQGLGLGFLGSDYSGIANQTTDLLRQQARPYEDLATTRALDRLNSRGGLGISTVLQDTFRGLNDEFGQQDLEFQLAGLNRADTLRQQDYGVGQNLLGLGTQQGLGQQDQLLQALGLLSNTGIQGAQTAFQGRGVGLNEALGQFGAGQQSTQQIFDQLLAMLSGSTAVSTARSGAGANAGQLSAISRGNQLDFLGGLAQAAAGYGRAPATTGSTT